MYLIIIVNKDCHLHFSGKRFYNILSERKGIPVTVMKKWMENSFTVGVSVFEIPIIAKDKKLWLGFKTKI